MRVRTKLATLATVLAASVASPPADAAGPRACTVTPRSIAAEREAERREADESRVADWLARRILSDVADTDPVLDISADEVRAATGVDAATLDADRVRNRVAMKLRELAVGPAEAWEPSNPLSSPPADGFQDAPAAVPQPDAKSLAPAPAPRLSPSRPTPDARSTPRVAPDIAPRVSPKATPPVAPKPSSEPAPDAAPELEPGGSTSGRRAAEDSSCGRTLLVR